MPRWTLGVLLCLVAASFPSCRTDKPPQIPICGGDGTGGAECDFTNVPFDIAPPPLPGIQDPNDPNKRWLKPSELKNFWMTSPAGMKHFAAWCYDVDPSVVEQHLESMQMRLLKP